MKDERFFIAGRGLKLMLFGQITALLAILPMIGAPAGIVGAVITIIGLVMSLHAGRGYQRALVMAGLAAASAVLKPVMALVAASGMAVGSSGAAAWGMAGALLMGAAASVFQFLMVYFVCAATSGLLREIGQDREAERGGLVWKLNAVCCLVAVIIAVAAFTASGLPGSLNSLRRGTSLAAGILYIIFLYESYHLMLF